ncbi:unnamed protein product [Schistosoma margrebowiei]|uniref:Uncharacterized protein n=1 Tax=Schistosoma margrebowiei TaxID=48269 RepID=A0A183LRK5_9TREM|nr:unnamed protein product [Schistosoma margrebowiei]
MVVGGSRQAILDSCFVLLGTHQQRVPVILRELVLPGGFDLVSPSFTVRDVTPELSKPQSFFYNPSQLFTLQIQGEFHKKLFLLQLNRSIYLPHIINYKYIQYLILIAFIISLLFSMILFILYIILPLFILFDTELCRYVNTDSGILITDFIIDLYIQYQWSNFTLLLNNNILNYINLSPPKHIYSTIRNKCQPIMYNNYDLNITTTTTDTTDNTTNNTTNTINSNNNNNHTYSNYNLLKLLNYSQIINFDKLLYSTIIQEKIKDAEMYVIKFSLNSIIYDLNVIDY